MDGTVESPRGGVKIQSTEKSTLMHGDVPRQQTLTLLNSVRDETVIFHERRSWLFFAYFAFNDESPN